MPTYSVSTVTATLVAATAYTAIELKPPASTGIKVLKWWVEFNSITASNNNVLVQLGLFSAAVTTLTAVAAANVPKVDYGGGSLNAQSVAGINATVEGAGTFTANQEQHSMPPNGGMTFWEPEEYAWQFPFSSASVRLRITPGAALTTTTATCGVVWLE